MYDDDVHNKVQNSLCKTNLTLLEMQKKCTTDLPRSIIFRSNKEVVYSQWAIYLFIIDTEHIEHTA